MKKSHYSILLIASVLLLSCGENKPGEPSSTFDWNQEASLAKASSFLQTLSWDEVNAFSFVDRSYASNYYYNSKYMVTGGGALVNYKASHAFKLYEGDFVEDNVTIDALTGVESSSTQNSFNAEEQIYLQDNYIHDIFLVDVEGESYANCYPSHRYRTLSDYLNYDSVLKDSASALSNLEKAFPKDDGFLDPDIVITTEGDKEHYTVEVSYPGDTTYVAYSRGYDLTLDKNSKTLDSITMSLRYYKDDIDGAYETSTAMLQSYTISSLSFGKKGAYSGTKHTIDELPADKVHGAPARQIDLTNIADGELTGETALSFVNNILYYARDTRETKYSFIYHDAFDFASSEKTSIGDVLFEGKLIAYQNDILDNHGSMRKVNSKDEPYGESASYWIFAEAKEDYIQKGGKFDKWITSSYAGVDAKYITDLRSYLDANPLFYGEMDGGELKDSEFKKQLSLFSSYPLGKTKSDGSTLNLSVKGNKSGNSITLEATSAITLDNSNASVTNTWSFLIQSDYLTSFSLKMEENTHSNTYYCDTYEAVFLHAPKQVYKGEAFNYEEIQYQVYWSSFNVI